MSKQEKALRKVLPGTSDNNVSFSELCGVLRDLGFVERVRGSHRIFTRSDVAEIINLQPQSGMAKGYQVRQVRELIGRYELGGDSHAE